MIDFKKPLRKKEELLNPLASSFLDRLIETQFKKRSLEHASQIDFYTQCLTDIVSKDSVEWSNGDFFQTLDDDGKKIYNSINLMFENWKNIDSDQGGYITLNNEDIHSSFRVEIQPYNIDFLQNCLTPDEAKAILQHFKDSDLLAYTLCLFIFSTGIAEKDLLGMKTQDFEPKMKGRNNLLKALIFTDLGGHINDKGSSSRIYLINPFVRKEILDIISQYRNLNEVKPSHVFFKGMGKIVNKEYLKELCQRIGAFIGKEVNFKSLRGTHARLLYEDIPLDLIGFSIRTELIHSALIGFGVGLKHISQALPTKK